MKSQIYHHFILGAVNLSYQQLSSESAGARSIEKARALVYA